MLKFLDWVIPIILELFKKNPRLTMYTKRNISVVMLVVASLLSLLFNIYLFEQASVHGAMNKETRQQMLLKHEKLEECVANITAKDKLLCIEPPGPASEVK